MSIRVDRINLDAALVDTMSYRTKREPPLTYVVSYWFNGFCSQAKSKFQDRSAPSAPEAACRNRFGLTSMGRVALDRFSLAANR